MLVTRTAAVFVALALTASLVGAQQRPSGIDVSHAEGQQNEPSIAIDPENPRSLVVAAHDYRHGIKQAGVWATADGGASWSSAILDELDPALGIYEGQGDVSLAALPGGVFFLGYIDHDFTDAKNRIVVARSDDGGRSWPRHAVLADHPSPTAGTFEDKPYLAVDDTKSAFRGNLYAAWTRIPNRDPQRIVLARSLDGGATFGAPVQLGSPGAGPAPCRSSGRRASCTSSGASSHGSCSRSRSTAGRPSARRASWWTGSCPRRIRCRARSSA
jgi:hypothetical protein